MTTNNALITRSDIDQIIRCNAHAGRASWIKHPRSKVLAAAMLREEDFQPAQIPFVGFYESSISAVFDDAVNSELDRYKDEGGCGLTDEELEDCVRGCTISKADAAEIARAWVDRYEDYLSDAANDLADENDQQDQIRLHFASYNAETNACDFAGYVRRRFAPASGWVPFYSEDVRRWGPVTTWNAAQIGVLLDFICPDRRLTEYGLDDRIRECVQELAGATFDEQIEARKAA